MKLPAVLFNFILFVCCCSIQLSGVEISDEVRLLQKQTQADPELSAYIQQFPYDEYKIYAIEGLGRFFIDAIPDGIKWHLRNGIYWEKGIADYVAAYTQPNTIALDLGAHIGIHTLTMARKVGSSGKVIAFEPQNKIFRELFYNVRLNQLPCEVILLHNAVGDEAEWVHMSPADPSNEGGTPIGAGGDHVFAVTLDSLNLSNVSFIKMDVESYELKVLQGAKQTLLRNKPTIVFEILGGVDLDHCSPEIYSIYQATIGFLVSLGYHVERIFGNDFIAVHQDVDHCARGNFCQVSAAF